MCICIQEWKEVSITVLYGKQCTSTEIGVTEFCMRCATRKYNNGECVLISTQRLHSNLLVYFLTFGWCVKEDEIMTAGSRRDDDDDDNDDDDDVTMMR